MAASTLVAASLFGGTAYVGFSTGDAGSLTPTALGGATCKELRSASFDDIIVALFAGDVRATLAGKLLYVDGVGCAISTAGTYDSGANETRVEWSRVDPFIAGTSYQVEVMADPTPTQRSIGAFAAGLTSCTPALPATYSVGDRLLLFVETANQAVTTPSGWSEVVNSPQGTGTAAGTSATRLTVFTRVAGASESAPTVTGTSLDHAAAQIAAFSPCDIALTAGSVQTTNSTTVSFPALSPSTTSNLVLAIVTSMVDIATARASAWTNGFTEQADNSTTQGNGGGIAWATKAVSAAGAVGATQATMATTTLQGKMMIALAPSAGGAGSASAAIGTVNATAPAGSGKGAASASATLATATAAAPSATASAGSAGNASAAIPAASASEPAGSATGAASSAVSLPTCTAIALAALATGTALAIASFPATLGSAPFATARGAAAAVVTLPAAIAVAPTANASGVASATATVPIVTVAPAAASATGGAGAAGTLGIVTSTAPAATASGAATGNAAASLGTAIAVPAASTAGGNAQATAAMLVGTASAPAASATGGALIAASAVQVIASAPEASASGTGAAAATISVAASGSPTATAAGGAYAGSALATAGLLPPSGSAEGGGQFEAASPGWSRIAPSRSFAAQLPWRAFAGMATARAFAQASLRRPPDGFALLRPFQARSKGINSVINFPAKYADEVRNASVDFARLLASGETLTGTPTVTVTSGTVSLNNKAAAGSVVSFRIAGGSAGKQELKVLCATSAGQTVEEVVQFRVI